MTDLSQAVIQRQGNITILTSDRILFGHRGDKVVLRGPLHAMIDLKRPNGGFKGQEEIILRTPNETKEVVCAESDADKYDINISDLGALPPSPNIMEHVVHKRHLDHNTIAHFTMYHKDDMVTLRGPARLRVEWKDKKGGVRRAQDFTLSAMSDVKEFKLMGADETMVITGQVLGAQAPQAAAPVQYVQQPAPQMAPAVQYVQQPAPQPVMAPPPAPASPPAPPMLTGPYCGRLPDGILIKAPNNDSVYVMQGGQKRPLTGEGFNRMGYKWDNIWVLPVNEVNSVPTGPVVN